MAILSFLSKGHRVLLKPGGVVGKDRDQPSAGMGWVVSTSPPGSSFSALRIVDNNGRRVVAPGLEN